MPTELSIKIIKLSRLWTGNEKGTGSIPVVHDWFSVSDIIVNTCRLRAVYQKNYINYFIENIHRKKSILILVK